MDLMRPLKNRSDSAAESRRRCFNVQKAWVDITASNKRKTDSAFAPLGDPSQ